MIAAEHDNGLAEYDDPKAINASPLVRMCITEGATFRDKDKKCELTYLYGKLIAKEKEALACSYRSETGTCILGREKLPQKEIDELVKMVMDAQKK
jgi:hypothetical protein